MKKRIIRTIVMGGVKMKRQKDVILYVFVLLISFVSCKNDSDDPVEILSKRIDNAEMVEYIDSVHGAKLLYPDFFLVDTTKEFSDVRFYYSDENVKELSLNLSYYPPRFFENINKVVEIYESYSQYECIKKKKHSCIMKGKDDPNAEFTNLCKCKKGRYWWIVCTLTYEPQYERSVKRLSKIVKNWKPMPPENIPVWFSDICDFLDI
jgi:hypothetical protein